jgi:photosystem II stability/assembly factor-like uncharacterized protein
MKSKSAVRGSTALAWGIPAALMLLALPLAARTPATPPAADPAAKAVPDSAAPDDPSRLQSEIMPRASKSLLLDLVRTAGGYFAVGERGHVLRSDDGRTWTQLNVPTRSALTSIATADGQLWVGGHDGVILHSTDGGQTWQAQRRDPFRLAEGQDAADHDPRQGAPVLDINFRDGSHGIAIGAYSLMLVTDDGGATWTPRQALASAAAPDTPAAPMQGDLFSAEDLQLDEEADPHFNAITEAGPNTLVIVGERGTLLRSGDDGATWKRLPFPYKGSMFGVLHLGDSHLLAFGLRGNVYESRDGGNDWNKVETQGSTSLMGGSLLTRAAADSPFVASTFRNAAGETPMLAGVLPAANGNLVLIGDKGAELYHPQ